ncbi:MAG TPA: twin-arginine translocation signal domain-containing protein [Woeseiaceae bacterium]|nr:twin-arginine translocation signal domain-containing protein [Woeseiaceae bacterium]
MSRKSRVDAGERRNFLKKLAVAGGATAAVAVGGRSVMAEPAGTRAPAKPDRQGYRETPHIRAYYEKASL